MQATASYLFPGRQSTSVSHGLYERGVILLEYEGMFAIPKHNLNGLKQIITQNLHVLHVIHLAINHYNLTNVVYVDARPHRNMCGAL